MELRVQILPGLVAKIYMRGWGELLLMLESLQDNNDVGNRWYMQESPDKYEKVGIYGGAINPLSASVALI